MENILMTYMPTSPPAPHPGELVAKNFPAGGEWVEM